MHKQTFLVFLLKRGTKDTKGAVKLINLKQTDNAMAKNEKKRQTNLLKTSSSLCLKF